MTQIVEFCSPRAEVTPADFDVYPRAYGTAVLRRLREEAFRKSELRLFERQRPPEGAGLDWVPEVGAACNALARGWRQRASLQGALALAGQGGDGEWSLSVSEPTTASFAGHRLQFFGEVHCAYDERSVTLRSNDRGIGDGLVFRRDRGSWRSASESTSRIAIPSFLTAQGFTDRYVVASAPIRDDASDQVPEWPPQSSPDCVEMQDQAAQQISIAIETIRSLGEHYAAWLAPMLRCVAATRKKSDTAEKSASSPKQPGVIHISFPADTEWLGQILVHEVSHQYFFLTSYINPLTNDNDENLYYSTLKRKERKIDRILLALHATANMALYWSDLIALEGNSPKRHQFLTKMTDHTRHLGHIADQSGGLTDAGQRFWTIQKELLAERDLYAL